MQTDESLALGVQNGEPTALVALIERHHDALIGYLYRMTGGDRMLAEDLTQEACLRMMRAIDQYRYPRPFKPWLYRIATNLVRDHFKSATVQRTVTLADNLSHGAGSDTPEAIAIKTNQVEQIIGVMTGLPEHQREVIILRYYQEWSLNEIADALNIPIGTVKSRLSLGLKRVRELLEVE